MALEGQLSDFNLADIMQLLASQQKSGFLNLETTRNMVFIFDKGTLISTRDRRSRYRDPLESYLMAYGFFAERDWAHIAFVKQNSTLDLAEILVSESLLTEEELNVILRSLAQELTHLGMTMKRGSYSFSPTQGTPPGVKWRYDLDVQSLLMEAARRIDEEPQLKEALPSQAITFSSGAKTIPDEALSPTARHIMGLALAGLPLGAIIRQGRCESFVVRNLLKVWLGEGFLEKHQPESDDEDGGDSDEKWFQFSFETGLRSTPLTLLALVVLCVLGWWRFSVLPPAGPYPGQVLRESQLRSEVVTAARLFRYRTGAWPRSLNELVRTGQLAPSVKATTENLGWKYKLNRKRDTFTFGV